MEGAKKGAVKKNKDFNTVLCILHAYVCMYEYMYKVY